MTTKIRQTLSMPILIVVLALLQQLPTSADDYVHLKAISHEVSTASDVEYTLVPVLSLAFVDRNGFVFQSYLDGSGRQVKRRMGQYSLKKEKESNGRQVLRVFHQGHQTEYGLLLPVDDDKLGKVLVYTATKQFEGKESAYTLVFKKAEPDPPQQTFLKGFLSGIEKLDRDALNAMLKKWLE